MALSTKGNELNQWKLVMDAQAGQGWQNNPIYKDNASWYQSELQKLNKPNKTSALSNLGSLGQFISDDTNNLDNVSMSTNNGLKVNLANNRNKESGEPKIKLEDMDFSGLSSVGSNVANSSIGPGVANNSENNQAQFPAMQPRWNGVIDAEKKVRTDATHSFIKENSAKMNFKPYYLPLGDGEEYYVESAEEEEFLENSNIEEREVYMGLPFSEQANFLANRTPPKNRFGHESGYEEPLPTGMDALYPTVEGNTLMPMLDGEPFVGQDDALVSATEISPYDEAIADGDMDLARQIREQGNADNYQRFEDLKKLYPNQAMTSKYYPDVDYSSQSVIDDINKKNNDNLSGEFDFWDPMMSTIGFAKGAENTEKYSGDDSGIFGLRRVDLDDEGVSDINSKNKSILSNDDEALILDDIYRNKYGFNEEDALADQQAGSGLTSFEDNYGFTEDEALLDQQAGSGEHVMPDGSIMSNDEMDSGQMDEQQNYEIQETSNPDVTSSETVEMMDEQQNYEVTPQEIDAETVEIDVAGNELDATDPTIKTTVDEVITESQANGDSPEVTESKLSELFGGLKDIFGVDNKSLLRAFVKYVGGRVFGLSSGKAANFAWKGIEQDMATESAKGAEARKYADNMAAYGKQYDAAMAAGDTEGANRILQKMNTESGIDKSDPEKYYEGLEFLQNKKAEAISSGNADLVKGIDAQIKRWEQGGIDGTTTPTDIYDIKVQDENGNELILNARDGTNGRMVQMPNGEFVDLKDFKADGFGTITHAGKVNASGAGPTPFKMAGQRYNSETDADFEKQLDDIDAKLEAGTISEEEAFNERSMIQNSNNNRNSDGELYKKKIPYAESISDSGVAFFPPQKDAAQKSSYQLAEGARGLAKLETIQSNPKAMAMVNKWTATWQSISNTNKMSYGQLSTYIAREFTSNPLQQAYYMGMLELTTSKLRRDTGAAYNMKEMMDTMERYTNFKDSSGDVTSMKLANAKLDLEAIAGNTRSGPYWLGVLDGTYRPSDSWQNTIGSIYDMMENEGVYTSSSGNGNGNGSDRDFSEYD